MTTDPATEPYRRTTRDHVVEALREMLFTGRFAPGEPIREQEIAVAVGASRGPVREAMIQLSAEGLLRFDRYRGNAVIDPDLDDVRELLTMRGALEGFAAGLAAAKPDRALLAELNQRVAQMRQASENENRSAFFDLDLDFHRTVVRMADHRVLLETWAQVRNRFALSARLVISDLYDSHDQLVGLAERHQALVDPIESGDVDLARRRSEDHPLDALRRYELKRSKQRSAW